MYASLLHHSTLPLPSVSCLTVIVIAIAIILMLLLSSFGGDGKPDDAFKI